MLKKEKNFDDFEKNCQSVNKTTHFNGCENNSDELPYIKSEVNEKTAEFIRPAKKLAESSAQKAQRAKLAHHGTTLKDSASAIITLASVAVFSAACIFLPHIVSYNVVDTGEISADSNQDGVSADTATPNAILSEIRIFREYNGKVGVFFADGTLDFIIDTPFESLPEYDRKLLENGIIAQGQEEIAFLAEGLEE